MPAMMLLWGVALVLATAATTYVLHRKLTHGRGPEPVGLFWDLFGGLVVIAPAILVPAVQWAPAGLIMVFVGIATAAGTLASIRKVERIHAAEPRRRAPISARVGGEEARCLYHQCPARRRPRDSRTRPPIPGC